MFNYSYLNKDCPEEKMEPQKSKKTKISKPLLVDAATLDQMRLRFDQIKQKNALPEGTSSKIPIAMASIVPPGITIKKGTESTRSIPPIQIPPQMNSTSINSDFEGQTSPPSKIPRLATLLHSIAPLTPRPVTVTTIAGQISPPTNISRPVTSNHIALPKTTPRPVPLVNTDDHDVEDLTALMIKMSVIEKKIDKNNEATTRKLDALNTKMASLQRIMGTMSDAIDAIRQSSINEVREETAIHFPIKNDEELKNLEVLLVEEQFEKAFRSKLKKEKTKDAYHFMRNAVGQFFYKTTRHTWSGRVGHNSGHEEDACKASNLNVVRILLDVAMEIFPITRDTAIQEFKKALQNKNAAVHMNKVRDAKFVHE
ncbi:uncharacterized protein LOC5575662 isoform X2 [Aedes aegypti]|nr:uncharacterized protein LOC5575662 isoform X2 [Aedes aegypti]